MKYFSIILKVPDEWQPGPELTNNPHFAAGSWSHLMYERDDARSDVERLKVEVEQLKSNIEKLKGLL